MVAEHPVRPRALRQHALVLLDQRRERARLPRGRDQVHVRRHVHAGAVVAGEPLERHVQLADHHAAALGDRLRHRDHRREVVMVGAVDRQQLVVLRLAGPVVRVRRVVAQLRVLQHLAQRVDAEAVDAAVEPEAQDAEHRLAQLGVAPVEVGLLAQVGVVVEAAALGVERPPRPAEHAEPVVRRLVGPAVVLRVLAEPRVLVRRVVRDEVEQQPQPALVRGGDQRVGVGERAEHRLDVGVVGDVVAEVLHRRAVDRRQPGGVDAEPGQVVEARGDPAQVADPVAVGVGERARIDVVDDAPAPPAHASAASRRSSSRRSASSCTSARARSYSARASPVRPSRRSSSPRVACR